MKNAALPLVLSIALAFGCDGAHPASSGPSSRDTHFDGAAQASAARLTWNGAAPNCRTYHYATGSESYTGTRTHSLIEITDGHPSARTYLSEHRSNGAFVVDESWTEVGPDVGSHATGPDALTMEQLYDLCLAELGRDSSTNKLIFRADERGALIACGAIPVGCADDCGASVSVQDFDCGPLPR